MIIDMINFWFQFLLSSCLGVPSISHMCWQPSWVAHRRCHSGRYIRRPCSTLESGNTRWKNKFLNNILLDESDKFSNVDWWRLLNRITIQPASQIHVFAILCWLNLTRIIITKVAIEFDWNVNLSSQMQNICSTCGRAHEVLVHCTTALIMLAVSIHTVTV